MKLKIAVHKSCVNKTNANKVAKNWSNIHESLDWLMGWVGAGYGWCSTHFVERHRKSENTTGSNLVVIDIDGDTTLEKFWACPTVQQWCAATYTSNSHSAQEHRFRALFPLEIELNTPGQHKGAYWLIVNRLLQELGIEQLADNCGQKAERLWYGNTNAEFKTNPAACVPSFLLEDIDFEDSVEFVGSDVSDIDVKRCQWLLQKFLDPSDDGEYETKYVPVMAACAAIGQVLFDDWVDWVLRGHHGHKEENIQAFKWRGLGNYSGPAKLYSLAKKQDPNWTKQLPSNIRFGAVGSAVGYIEVDPLVNFDDVLSTTKSMNNMNPIDDAPEPLPDQKVVAKKRGRPSRSSNDAASERINDVKIVTTHLGELRRNELTNGIEYTLPNKEVVELQGNDLDLMTTKFACEYGEFIPEQRMKNAVQYAANQNSYCPIRRYLERCCSDAEPHPMWDSIGVEFLGNKHPLATLTMQRMMIGAVARAFNAGCPMSWLPILVGAQGVGKSMFSRSLVPEKLFTEMTTPLDTLMKEQYRLHFSWLIELPEIDNYFHTKNIEHFKNLVTTRVDEIRYPYAALPSKLPRRFVMIGTTNRNQFLVDSTGNRRFIPLEIGAGFLIPWERIAKERDQLWAAALREYRNGTPHEFNSGEIAKISDYIQEFGDPDPWMEKVSSYLSTKHETSPSQILSEALEVDPRQQGRRESKRVVDVLQTFGWRRLSTSRKDPVTGKNKSVRVWVRPKDDPLDESTILNDF